METRKRRKENRMGGKERGRKRLKNQEKEVCFKTKLPLSVLNDIFFYVTSFSNRLITEAISLATHRMSLFPYINTTSTHVSGRENISKDQISKCIRTLYCERLFWPSLAEVCYHNPYAVNSLSLLLSLWKCCM